MVYLVHYKYIAGWHTINSDIFYEINSKPIYGIYNDYRKGLIEAITFNIKNHSNSYIMSLYSEDNLPNFIVFNMDELKDLHIKIMNSLEGDKYTIKYCDIKELSIEDDNNM